MLDKVILASSIIILVSNVALNSFFWISNVGIIKYSSVLTRDLGYKVERIRLVLA
jgi:hypothetical protein